MAKARENGDNQKDGFKENKKQQKILILKHTVVFNP